MIYFFSGTGNSRCVAEQLSLHILEKCRMITEVAPEQERVEGDSIGFIFPVYSWGVAPMMMEFVKRLPESFWAEVKIRQIPVWCVMTCGDEVALAPEMFAKRLGRYGIVLESVWSVIMPNNYVILPGFDVDPREVERKKLRGAAGRIREISCGILQHSRKIDVVRGSWAWLKTKMVYPLFCRWGITPKKWYATVACVGCGLCKIVCPLHNIYIRKRVPEWGDNCCSCLACYHVCPRHAVAYGKQTFKKGQYFNPDAYNKVKEKQGKDKPK